MPSAVQWTLSYTAADFASGSVAAGPQAIAARKAVSCRVFSGSTTCMAWGNNAAPISNGVVATISLNVSSSTTNTSSSVQVSGTLGVDATGNFLPISAEGSTVTITQPAGLNGFSCNPLSVSPAAGSNCTVWLTAAAPSGGSTVALTASPADAVMPASLIIPNGATSGTFSVTAGNVAVPTNVTLTAAYLGVNESIDLTVNPMTGLPNLPMCAAVNTAGVPLFWQNDVGLQSTVWLNTGPAQNPYQDGAGWTYVSGTGDPDWRLAGSGDFNGDGTSDLVWQSQGTGKVSVCLTGTSSQPVYLDPSGQPGWHIAAIGDFDRDGHPDLVWVNDTTGQATVWYMGGTSFLNWAYISQTPNPGWDIVGAGDFNRDGNLDLVWQNTSTRQVTVWYMKNNVPQSWAWVSAGGTPGETVVGVGDVNGDGWPDLFLQSDTTRAVTVWYMNGIVRSSTVPASPGEPGWTAIRR